MHATEEEARQETMQMLNIYADFMENVLAMPVVRGRKTDKEKFNGAEETYTVECMMHDRKALQAGTSHYFGDGFARAFDITFTGKDNQLHHPHQTSWGVSTRMIGGIIMTHGDNNGPGAPPPHRPHPGHGDPCGPAQGGRAGGRLRPSGPSEGRRHPGRYGRLRPVHGLEGRPVRDEGRAPCGWRSAPKDMEKGPSAALCRRDSRGRRSLSHLDELESKVQELLDAVHDGLYARAKKNLEDHTQGVPYPWTRSRPLWRPRAASPRPCGAATWSAS